MPCSQDDGIRSPHETPLTTREREKVYIEIFGRSPVKGHETGSSIERYVDEELVDAVADLNTAAHVGRKPDQWEVLFDDSVCSCGYAVQLTDVEVDLSQPVYALVILPQTDSTHIEFSTQYPTPGSLAASAQTLGSECHIHR